MTNAEILLDTYEHARREHGIIRAFDIVDAKAREIYEPKAPSTEDGKKPTPVMISSAVEIDDEVSMSRLVRQAQMNAHPVIVVQSRRRAIDVDFT